MRSSVEAQRPAARGWVGALADPVPDLHAQSGGRLRARYLVGDDGSRQFMGWHDTQRDDDCSFAVAADGLLRCLPTTQFTIRGYFADAECTMPLLGVASATCPTSGKLYGGATDCDKRSVYELTPATVSTTYLSGTGLDGGTICDASPASGYAFYTGVEAPASSFATASEQRE